MYTIASKVPIVRHRIVGIFLFMQRKAFLRAEAILSALQSASSAFKSILRLPMPVSESGSRCVRVCSQARSSLLPDSLASAPAFAGRHRACSWKKTWRCVPMRPWRFKIRLSPSVSGHSVVCLLSCATKICRAETNIKKSRDIPPNSQKLLLLLPVSIYLRKKT